jgi:hypothetical protein
METILNIVRDYGMLSYAILFLYCALKVVHYRYSLELQHILVR